MHPIQIQQHGRARGGATTTTRATTPIGDNNDVECQVSVQQLRRSMWEIPYLFANQIYFANQYRCDYFLKPFSPAALIFLSFFYSFRFVETSS